MSAPQHAHQHAHSSSASPHGVRCADAQAPRRAGVSALGVGADGQAHAACAIEVADATLLSLLDLIARSEQPLLDALDLLVVETGAAFAAVLERARHAPQSGVAGVAVTARARGERSIAHPERLLSPAAVETLLERGAPYGEVLEAPRSRQWRAGAPVLSPGAHPARRALLLGGPLGRASRADGSARSSRDVTALPAHFTEPSGAVGFDTLRSIASWLAIVFAVEDRSVGRRGAPSIFAAAGPLRVEDAIDPRFPEIITRNARMRAVLETIEKVAPTDAAVLVEGESGTGKELIARALHQRSSRRERPFLTENCAACPANLLEAEFFGVERGAYTGATRSREGVFERARGGTLFLDEIGETDGALQSKLLRVLQEREVRRVGGSELVAVDFRLVTATNRSLERDVAEGRFRLDLLYRLEVVKLTLPPLRERVEDIPYLATHMLAAQARRLHRAAPVLHPLTLDVLMRHPWPGNVRELQNEMLRQVVFGREIVWPVHLSARFRSRARQSAQRAGHEPVLDFARLESDVLGAILRASLRYSGGNRARAAKLLGLPRSSFYRRLERYGILGEDPAEDAAQENPVARALSRYAFLDDLFTHDGSGE